MKKFYILLVGLVVTFNFTGIGTLGVFFLEKPVEAQSVTNEKDQFLQRRDDEILGPRPTMPTDIGNSQTAPKPQQQPLDQLEGAPIEASGTLTGYSAQVLLTHGDKSKLLSTEPNINFEANEPQQADELAVRVEPNKTYQTMEGFGAAMTDSSAWLMQNKLSAAQRETLFNNLFTNSGANLNMLRLPVGSSDFALNYYTMNDLPLLTDTDIPQNNFNIGHDLQYIIPMIQLAQTKNSSVKTIATPWSAPGWMKENYVSTTAPLVRGNLKADMYDSYATYFQKLINSYLYAGVGISYVSPQNEPLHTTGWLPSMGMTAQQQTDFIKNNLKSKLSSTFMNPGILTFDHNWSDTSYPLAVLADADAKSKTAGTAFHCYNGDVTKQLLVAAAHPDKGIYFTECTGSANAEVNFGPDFRWGMHNIMIGSVRNYAKSVQYWNLALDETNGPRLPLGSCSNCRGIVTINSTTGNVTYNTEYYLLGHFGRMVQPGATRIESTSYGEGAIESVGFKNPDGSRVLVAANTGATTRTFSVREGNASFRYTLPANSAASFKWAMPANIVRDVSTGRIEAESYSSITPGNQGLIIGDENKLDGGLNLQDNSQMVFQNLNFESANSAFQLRYKTNGAMSSTTVEFRADSATGPLLATIPITPQATYTTSNVTFNASGTVSPGNHDVYLLVKNSVTNGEQYPIQINWFKMATNQKAAVAMSNANFRAYGTHVSGTDIPANALDSDSNTRWSVGKAQTLGHSFTVDFTQPTALSHSLMLSNNGDHLRSYKVEASDDGVNFTTVRDTSSSSAALYDISPIQPIITRYVRISAQNQNSIGSWWSVHGIGFSWQ